MRQFLSLSAALALGSFALASCGDETTQPSTAPDQPPTVPEFAVAHNTWLTRADMWSVERYDFATATVTNAAGQSILYAIGGRSAAGGPLSKVMAYNVATNTWTLRASLPKPLWGVNGAGVLNGKIYISGGCFEVNCAYSGYSSMLYMYDPAANTWTPKHTMPQFGAQGVTGVINGKLYVLTNCYEHPPIDYYFDNCDQPLQNFFRYNPVTDRWIVLPSPTGMYSVGGVLYDKLYVTDGANVEVYDPTTNQWTTKRQGPQRRIRAAGAVLGGKLYLTGGSALTGDLGWQPVRTTKVYRPLSDTWSTAASLPTDRVGSAGARVFVNGQARLEVVGGSRPGNNLQYIP